MSVYINKITNKDIEKAVYENLKGLNYKPKKNKLLIKPNIVNEFNPGEPYITDYRVVKGIILYLKDIGFKDITVGEAPINRDTNLVFSMTGYKSMCDELNVKILDLEEVPHKIVKWKFGEISLPEIVFDAEYINVPKLKTHLQTTVTLGLKNQKGLLNLKTKRRFHHNLHENIAALAECISPSLTVVDAINGIEGNGPGRFGNVVPDINLIISGTEFLALDAITTAIMGFNPEEVKHLKIAKDMGLGKFEDKVSGESINSVKMNFAHPTDLYKIFNIHYRWTDETCSGCSGILGDLKKEALKNPYYLYKLFFRGLLMRLDLLMGPVENLSENRGLVICAGNCAKKNVDKYNAVYVPGCPPTAKDVLDKLTIFKNNKPK